LHREGSIVFNDEIKLTKNSFFLQIFLGIGILEAFRLDEEIKKLQQFILNCICPIAKKAK